MEDRDTFELVTPLKNHKVVLKSWITGRESQAIDNAMFSGLGTTGDGKSLRPKISGTMLADQENKALELIVVSVDGATTKVVDKVLDMRKADYEAVSKEVQRVVDGDIPEKKEKSLETNTSESSTEDKEKSPTTASK